MSVDSKKTILLEKKYLYVRASLGFQLEGTSTEIIPTNNGFYRFYIDNLSKALGNSYVNILYDSNDLTFQSFCSDLYMDELMSSDSSAIEDVVAELINNTVEIEKFENGVSSALQSNHEDNVAIVSKLEEFESGVSTGMASNHADNVALNTLLTSLDKRLLGTGVSSGVISPYYYPLEMLVNSISYLSDDVYINPSPSDFKKKVVDNNIFYEASYFVRCKNGVEVAFNVPVPSDSTIKYKLFAQCNSYNTNPPFSDYTFRVNGNNYENKLSTVCYINYNDFTSYALNVQMDSKSFEYFCSFSNCEKFSSCSFFDKTLIINDVFGHSVFNQRFNFDFDGGYLNLKFYSSLSPSELNTRTLRFFTDMGYYDFSCSDLNFYNAPAGFKGLLLCSNSPQIEASGSIKKLFGISCF